MKTKLTLKVATALLSLSTLIHQPSTVLAQGTAFTYQGRLNDGASPANGSYDLRFTVYDSSGGPTVIAGPVTNAPTAVSNGPFTVTLDFGTSVFPGAARWLEIAVRTNGGGAFTALAPRQQLTPTPYAIFADGAQAATTVAAGGVNSTALANGAVGSNAIADGSIAASDLSLGLLHDTFWRLGGNTGTTPGTHFLGTTDNQPLELKAHNVRALRIEPTATSPNLIGGHSGNAVAPGMDAVVIAGGGRAGAANYAGAELTAIGGGWANTNLGGGATISGGFLNRIESGAFDGTLGGGKENVIRSNSVQATLSGGQGNVISSGASFATIGGGRLNTVSTNGRYATVGGGGWNVADAPGATIGGGGVNALYVGANRVHGQASTIGGGWENLISTNAGYGTIAGGWGNLIQTNTQKGTIGGGQNNWIGAEANAAVIVGGYNNSVHTGSVYAVVGGGNGNTIGAGSTAATIGGGQQNEVTAAGGTVGGGGFDGFSYAGNKVHERAATIGGGVGNTVASNAAYATIGGGANNTIQTNAGSSVISGGQGNEVGVYARSATIAGGIGNQVTGDGAVVGGGGTDGSGFPGGNQALGAASVVAGGYSNTASDAYAMIPGGRENYAAFNAFAAGRRAKAYHGGSFVWADSTAADFASTSNNQFNIRAAGGARFETSGAGMMLDGLPVFTGTSGSALTALNASQLTSGTVPAAALANAWTIGGNAGTTPGSHFLGTTDSQPLEFKVNGQRALRLEPNATSPNVIGGYSGNVLSNGFFGAFIGGGGDALFPNRVGGSYASVIGGRGNTASAVGATAAGNGNTASGVGSTAMGSGNTASGSISAAMGFRAQANHEGSFVWSDYMFGDFSSTAANQFLIRAGGGVGINTNNPSGAALRVNGFTALDGNLRVQSPGDVNNPQLFLSQTAAGDWSRLRLQSGGPAWDIALGPGANPVMSFYNGSAPVLLLEQDGDAWLNQNLVFQPGTLRQMVDLWNGEHAIGVQSWTTYFRTIGGPTPGAFAWYRGGAHADGQYDSGGGEELMRLNASGLTVRGTFVSSSDRNLKENFKSVDAQAVLEKVATLPLSEWNYKQDTDTRHLGPMAQDFHAAFGVGPDDQHIATVDADGVALAAIQGLNEKVEVRGQKSEGRIQKLEAENLELKQRLERLERILNEHNEGAK